jgi:hypothetical protein
VFRFLPFPADPKEVQVSFIPSIDQLNSLRFGRPERPRASAIHVRDADKSATNLTTGGGTGLSFCNFVKRTRELKKSDQPIPFLSSDFASVARHSQRQHDLRTEMKFSTL